MIKYVAIYKTDKDKIGHWEAEASDINQFMFDLLTAHPEVCQIVDLRVYGSSKAIPIDKVNKGLGEYQKWLEKNWHRDDTNGIAEAWIGDFMNVLGVDEMSARIAIDEVVGILEGNEPDGDSSIFRKTTEYTVMYETPEGVFSISGIAETPEEFIVRLLITKPNTLKILQIEGELDDLPKPYNLRVSKYNRWIKDDLPRALRQVFDMAEWLSRLGDDDE